METRRGDGGFSLVELMVAMTVTLIVSAAIYGLLTSGSNAFRREPELADRQQNIRAAMDVISRDVFNAGAALPTYAQVFTRSDPGGTGCTGGDGVNGCGVMGALGAEAAASRAPGDGGDPSENTDVLEIVAVDEQCPAQSVCSKNPTAGDAGVFVTRERVPACFSLPSLALLTDNTTFTVQTALATGTPTACPGVGGNAAVNGNVQLGAFLEPWQDSPAIQAPSDNPPPAQPVVFLYRARVARYRVAPSGDPSDPAPALWRSESGRYARDGSGAVEEPGGASFPAPGSPWEMVARGIEDLQIEYMAGDNVWRNQAPISVANDWTSLVRQVRITLSARTQAQNLQGQTTAGGGAPNAVRGQLTSVVAPRAAFNELQMGGKIK